MTGDGYEILVDYETRSFVLARFYNGRLLGINTTAQASQINGEGRADAGSGSGSGSYFEETIIIRTLLAS